MIKLKLNNRTVTTKLPALVMGILNATPDSFWEKSRGGIKTAFEIAEAGADIIDIGGESSRPGSSYVSAEEEIKRIIPIIKEIRKHSDIPISVDTRKKEVMHAAVNEGADILNDISALEDDPELGKYAAQIKLPVILMHKRGTPDVMQKNTEYKNVFDEVNTYLIKRAEYAIKLGILPEKIIIDPGIGFGKGLESNIQLIKNCKNLCGGKYKVLMALSRKTCIGDMTGRNISERLAGTLAANLLAVKAGTQLLRVHDVKETVDILKVLQYIGE